MKYIILVWFLFLSIMCVAQSYSDSTWRLTLESASPNLTVKHGIDADTVLVINPIGSGMYYPDDTAFYDENGNRIYLDTVPFIQWYDGISTLGDPFNIYDLVEIQRQVLEKLEIIQKQIEVIKRLDSLLKTDHSSRNSEVLKFIESIKADPSFYRKQQ